jgi:hypothetical protein
MPRKGIEAGLGVAGVRLALAWRGRQGEGANGSGATNR